MSEEKKQLSTSQLELLTKHRNIHEQMAYLLLSYIDSRDYNYVKSIDRMLLVNSKSKNKCFPRCHVLPLAGIQSVVYTTIHIPKNHSDFLLQNNHTIAVTNPNKLIPAAIESGRSIMVLNEFVPILCFGSMFEFLIKHTYKADLKARMVQAQTLYTNSHYLVRPSRGLDACDIVACPDKTFIQSLPSIIKRRIENYDLQYDMQYQINHPPAVE